MGGILARIQRAVRTGCFDFSMKARLEMQADELAEISIVESILNATAIYKSLRSNSPRRKTQREYLHIIISEDSSGLLIYTKGKLTKYGTTEIYYFFVSAKRSD